MYSVSQAFITAMKKAERVEHVRGTVGTASFTDDNILGMNYSNQCSDTKDVTLGSARIGQLNAQFVGLNIPRGSWRGLTIMMEYGLELADRSIEWIPAGVFTISEAAWSATGVSVTAYDAMSFLDKPISFSQSSGSIYGFLTLICSECDIELAITQAECEALPNGTELIGIYPGAAINTYRDLVSYIAAAVGGFATATRDGKLTLVSFADLEVVDEISSYQREYGSIFSDYTTQYSGISIVDMEDNTTKLYDGLGGSGALYITLGSNPLLQYGIQSVKDRMRTAVADAAASIKYTPFSAAVLSTFAYDLGDCITNSGGIAGSTDLTCCVMGIDWTFKSLVTLSGYGADPALTNGMSKAEKAVSALAKNQKSDGLTYYTFVNTEAVNLTTTAKKLYSIAFAVNETTTVTLWNEIKSLNTLSGDTQKITYEYYLDGVKFDYEPIDTFGEDGYHTEPHPFWLQNVESGRVHTWMVKAKIDSGTASVAIGDIHALIMGQKMAAQAGFDGNIEVSDEVSALELGFIFAELTENVELTTQQPMRLPSISDTVESMELGFAFVPIYENVVLTGESVRYRRITEDGDTRITEDGSVRMTE